MANQYEVDPRQALFLSYYLNPKSETFSNALQSALKAGYSQEYAENITNQMPDWLAENLGKEKMLKKAESNLEKILESPIIDKDNRIDKVVADVSKFTASRLGKDKWSERNEHSGPDGKAIPILAYVSSNNSNKENNGNEKQAPLHTGGNISEQNNLNSPLLDTLSAERQNPNTD